MKYLFYTISDLNPISLACTDILYKSLKNRITNLNFQVIVPQKYSNENTYKYPIKYIKSDYLSISRYDKEVFEQDYDYFIYLDSDIYFNIYEDTFFHELNSNDILLCQENQSIKLYPWHHMKMDNTFLEKHASEKAINSGFFCFKKEIAKICSNYILDNFKDVYNIPDYKKQDKAYKREMLAVNGLIQQKDKKEEIKNKIIEFMSEQSLFNKFLIENVKNYKIKDFSDKIELNKFWLDGKDIDFIITEDKMYHFCGHFNLNMGKKLFLMQNFIKNNNL